MKPSWSVHVPIGPAGDNELTPADRKMLLIVEGYCRNRSYCWAANRALAGDYGCSVRNVQLRLASLERSGAIHRAVVQSDHGDVVRQGIVLRRRFDTRMPVAGSEAEVRAALAVLGRESPSATGRGDPGKGDDSPPSKGRGVRRNLRGGVRKDLRGGYEETFVGGAQKFAPQGNKDEFEEDEGEEKPSPPTSPNSPAATLVASPPSGRDGSAPRTRTRSPDPAALPSPEEIEATRQRARCRGGVGMMARQVLDDWGVPHEPGGPIPIRPVGASPAPPEPRPPEAAPTSWVRTFRPNVAIGATPEVSKPTEAEPLKSPVPYVPRDRDYPLEPILADVWAGKDPDLIAWNLAHRWRDPTEETIDFLASMARFVAPGELVGIIRDADARRIRNPAHYFGEVNGPLLGERRREARRARKAPPAESPARSSRPGASLECPVSTVV